MTVPVYRQPGGATPTSLLQLIEDGTANVVGETVRVGETTVATISF